ncbi:uncharacterized protein [Littorina saxatilis]|uniref:Uncharacterized protein n=1 Tax=Littorina saxatilis TaxID=31220 RepID=A0AAN9AKX3_9CAEN
MEAKSGSRLLKKSANAGPGTTGDKRKAKQKKKKEKRKASLKGTESTDIPSPELDSEVPFDGDVTLTDQGEGARSPAGQVAKLPHLPHSVVSLTTQVLPSHTPTTTTNSSLRKLQLGQTSSAPTTRNSILTTATIATTACAGVDGVEARLASLTIKQRSSKPRTKTHTGKANAKSSRTRDRPNNKQNSNSSNSAANALSPSTTAKAECNVMNESLRWECVLEDVDRERDRLALYKLNRRKRYLAAAQAKGLRWALNYNTQITVSPLSEDSGVDTTYVKPGSYLNFAPMTSLRPMPAHRGLQEAFVDC